MIVHHPRPRPEPWSVVRSRVSQKWKLPFVAHEYLFDWAVHLLGNWAFLETLFYLESLSVLVAVLVYFGDADNRTMQRHYQAWQVINTAQGKGGNGGRIDALQQLVEDKVSLTGVDLEGAFLQGVRLDNAVLVRANFHNVDARSASLKQADLSDANLTGANLRGGMLERSRLRAADLSDADLSEASLDGADLTGATLDNADLQGTDLRDVKWQAIKSVKAANFRAAKNAPPSFIQWAMEHGAVLQNTETESGKFGQ